MFGGRRGFTMLEMLVVLAFMAIIAGISIPAVANISRSEAASELGIFNAFMKKTFINSVRRNEYLRIAVNMQSGDYWAEKTETPFFLMTGKEQEGYERQNEALLEDYDEAEKSQSALKSGTGASGQNFFQLLSMQGTDDAAADDLYNWENFVPERRNLRELLKPEFSAVSEKRSLPSSLRWTQFFSYHTPDIITPVSDEEDPKEKMAYIYFFPQGRISPFYLSIGEKEGEESFLHISADMYLGTKVEKGDFGEEVKVLHKELEEDKDEEGK
jgi:prepilin-type N-terminal cleavage/methylation domain-containing protein